MNTTPDEDVVITGMAGRFPESDNVYEFRDNLYNKVDMLTPKLDARWKLGELTLLYVKCMLTDTINL
jgi:acyl transferase domain-containing protein